MKKIFIGILIVVILLLIPFLTKDRASLIKNFPEVDRSDLNYTEVTFINNFDNTNLGGILFLPKDKDSIPLVVFVNGSGYSSRTNPWYLTLTKHLVDNNVAVLLPDKRGSEKSDGDWKGATIETLATDTEAALNYVKSLRQNFSKIGVIGMSQGGWIAPVVATKNDLDFVVDISGTLATAQYQLQFEETHNIAKYTYSFLAKPIAKLTIKGLKEKQHIKALLGFDPVPYWKNVKIPNLILYSEDDTNCPVERSIERVEENKLTHLNIKIYPKGGHAISNENRDGYREDFLTDLLDFVKTSN